MSFIKQEFLPKLEVLFRKGYSWKEALVDASSAVSIAMVSLPLSIAFAIAAGASPQQGIVCGVILGFFVSLLGGSRHAIAGPTGAFVVIIFDIIARQGMDGLGTATIVGGFILILFGLLRLGSFIRFIPFPLIVGFTTALGSLILLGQLKDSLGLPALKEPGFTKLIYHVFTHIGSSNLSSILVSIVTIFSALLLKAKFSKWPWAVLSIAIATVFAIGFDLSVPTLGSKFGSLSLFPWPGLPKFNISIIPDVFSDAFTIAALAGIEALLCCLVADAMTGTRHKSNIELVAQGVGTMACGFLGGIPGTNAISRTGANIRAGGRTPVAGLLHAVFLALIFAFGGPLFIKIPLAALSSVLILIAWHMAHYDRFIDQFKAPIPDILVMLVTFLITIFIDITVAVQIGMVLAAFLFVYQQSKRFKVIDLKKRDSMEDEIFDLQKLPKSTDIFEIQGPLFFGNIDKLKALLSQEHYAKQLILKTHYIPEVDASGMNILKTLHMHLKQNGCKLYLVGTTAYVRKGLDKYGVTDILGEDAFCANLQEACDKINKPK
jgi:sulfate permease, SulP family